MDNKKFVECMKKNMEVNGLTTESLSELTGISVARLKEYESRDFKARTAEIIAIGKALNVPPAVLMHGGGMIII